MIFVENMFEVYNVVVCILCFCYFWFLFGILSGWYKFDVYCVWVV